MPVLRVGSRGVYVEMLQIALQRAGQNPGAADGIFGERTKNAVIAFQRANGLVPDGVAGVLTWAQLKPYLTGYVMHTVARGETFWQLAKRYGTTVYMIQTANPTVNPLNLQIGSRIIIPLPFDVVPTNINYTYALVSYIMEGLAMRYPFLRTAVAGKSVMGKNLYAAALGKGKKQVFYNGTHHANEWITTVLLLKYLEEAAAAYATGSKISGYDMREVLDSVTLYMMPLVNPDGMDLVTGGLSTDSDTYEFAQEIAEKYPEIPFPSGWKANIRGTDLNLNYPASWEEARRIKYEQGFTTPAPRDFVGLAPLSGKESKAVYAYTLAHRFSLILAYHTQGEVIFWKYLDFEPKDSQKIAEEFSRVSGYVPEITPPDSAYAGYKDWFIQTYNLPGYTIEAGRGVNPLPITQFDKIYRDNVGILTLGMVLA